MKSTARAPGSLTRTPDRSLGGRSARRTVAQPAGVAPRDARNHAHTRRDAPCAEPFGERALHVRDLHTGRASPAPGARYRRLESPRAGGPGRAGDRVAVVAHRPARLCQDTHPDAPRRGARADASSLQRVAPELRRSRGLSRPGQRPSGLPADARDDLGRRVGAVRRNLALPAGTAEQAVSDRPREDRPGHRPREAASPLGRDEPAACRRWRRRQRHARVCRDGAARRRIGRPLRLHRASAVARRAAARRSARRSCAASSRPPMRRRVCGARWRRSVRRSRR